MNNILITIKNLHGEIVLKTTQYSYKHDLKENYDKLYIPWMCKVEYDDGVEGYDYPCNHNHKSPRRIVYVNGRTIYAEWTLFRGHRHNYYKDFLKYFDIDFKTTEQPKELEILQKNYMNFMRQTSLPTNQNMTPIKVEVESDLLDE